MSWWDSHDSLPTRASLLSRIKDWDDDESWRDFFDSYWKLIYSYACRSGLNDAEAQDVVQEVLLTVCKKIEGFKYDPARGKFKGWLLRTTKWRIGDQFRKRKPRERSLARHPDDTGPTDPFDRIEDLHASDLEAAWDEEWAKNLVAAAMFRIQDKVNPKHFQIFDAYVAQDLPVKQVMQMLGVSRAEVYLAKHRISRVLQKEIRSLEDGIS